MCVRASIPVAAVRCGGNPTVNSGSATAKDGIRCGLKISDFLPRPLNVNTALRPTSLPVPAVVGTAIMGGMSGPIRSLPPRPAS